MDCAWSMDSYNMTEAKAIGELVSNLQNCQDYSRYVKLSFW